MVDVDKFNAALKKLAGQEALRLPRVTANKAFSEALRQGVTLEEWVAATIANKHLSELELCRSWAEGVGPIVKVAGQEYCVTQDGRVAKVVG